MFKTHKINNEQVMAVPFIDVKEDKRPVKGANIFPEIYANIFLCARKKSGKTCAIAHIIDACSTSETRVIAFVSTLHRDPTWKTIEYLCQRRHIPFTGFTSLKDEATGEDILQGIVWSLEQANDPAQAQMQQSQHRQCIVMDGDPDPRKKDKKPKEKAPKIIFIIDDLSGELQNASLTQLLKKNRHFHCKVLISSQYFNDVSLQARKQLDYVLLYRGLAQSISKLNDIYKNCDLAVSFDVFVALYRFATLKKFCFLYIDVVNSEFRRNFNEAIQVPKEEDNEEI